jgi:hypothetical protein
MRAVDFAARQARVQSAPARRMVAVRALGAALRGLGRRVEVRGAEEARFFAFHVVVDGVCIDVACRAGSDGRLRFIVGNYSRYKPKNQFPEPAAGFDFARVALAVDAWAKFEEERRRTSRERVEREKTARADLESLFEARLDLQEYGDRVAPSAGGFEVSLRCTSLLQVETVLRAAKDAGIEP